MGLKMNVTNAAMDWVVILILLFEKFLDRFRSLESRLAMAEIGHEMDATHINKFLKILVETG